MNSNFEQNGPVQIQWLSKDSVTTYEVNLSNGEITSWSVLKSCKNLAITKAISVEQEEIALSIPYACSMMECDECDTAPNHTLSCLIDTILELSSQKKMSVEKICCQLAKASRFYYELPVWKLKQKIRHTVETQMPNVNLQDEFCVLDDKCFYEYQNHELTTISINSNLFSIKKGNIVW